MELEEGLVYKTPCVVWNEKSLLIYGSGSNLFVFDLKDYKLFKNIKYSDFNQNVRSIYVEKKINLILVAFDNKKFYIYNDLFELLLERSFSKKISFISSFNKGVIVGDLFGDISFLPVNLENLCKIQKITENDCKILIPFSHYSTITSSLIFNNLLFTGNKDGKIISNHLYDLHKIKEFFLSHKMSVSCLEIVGDNLLLSLSIDNSIRLWNISTGLEQFRLLIKGSNCLLYHLSCCYSKKLIILLLLDEVLIINFDFDKLKILNFNTFKLHFVCQTSILVNNELYFVDHYSNLHKIKSLESIYKNISKKGVNYPEKQKKYKKKIKKSRYVNKEVNSSSSTTNKGGKVEKEIDDKEEVVVSECKDNNEDKNKGNNVLKEGRNIIKLIEIMLDRSDHGFLDTEIMYNNSGAQDSVGIKINIKKHIDFD